MELVERIKRRILSALGHHTEEEFIENRFLMAIIEAFSRLETDTFREEKIRDSIVRDLETKNSYTKPFLDVKFFFLSFEDLENISDDERSRSDIAFKTTGFKFVLECKILKFASKKYLEEGLRRFIELKYAKSDDFAGMLGFIVAGEPERIIKNLKKKVKTFYPAHDIALYLEKTCAEHALSFQSRHLRINEAPIHIFHLFFDLSASRLSSSSV
ncbi:MAG: hypothetical protein HC913_17005 [Microscillaceae bacterium]|nr:hypothetical protein [Microscillaceae bacterium]